FKDMSKEIGGMIAGVLLPLTGMLQQVFDQIKKLDPETKKQIALWSALAIAWLGMGPVTQVIKDLLTPTFQLLRFIAIELPLMTARSIVWLAWKVVLGLAAAAMFVLVGFTWLFNSGQVMATVKV